MYTRRGLRKRAETESHRPPAMTRHSLLESLDRRPLRGVAVGAALRRRRLAAAGQGYELGPAELPLLQSVGVVERPPVLGLRAGAGPVVLQPAAGRPVFRAGLVAPAGVRDHVPDGPSIRRCGVVLLSHRAFRRRRSSKSSASGPALGAILLVALTGAAGLSQIGSTMNEWATAALVMAALFLVVRAVRRDDEPGRVDRRSGRLAVRRCHGAQADGRDLRRGARACVRRVLPWPAGLRARSDRLDGGHARRDFSSPTGYWGVVMWERFRNPFYPYFNGVFRSPYWEPVRSSTPSSIRRRLRAGSRCRSASPSATALRARPTCATRGSRSCACSRSSSPHRSAQGAGFRRADS